MKYSLLKKAALTGVICASLVACSDDDDDTMVMETPTTPTPMMFEVTLANITQGQIFSPPIVVTHDSANYLWKTGMAATTALEAIAEGGDTSQLAALSVIDQSFPKSAPVMPGDDTTWSVEVADGQMPGFSIATMLINTNDAFAGITGYDLSMLAVDGTMSKLLNVYDAGTESNDEINMPGMGNEGFNADRMGDDDRVHVHAGVLTQHELSTSLLKAEHKFDNPVAKLVIKRVQ